MKLAFRNLAVTSLIVLGGAVVFGASTETASAQSNCVTQCRSQGWSTNQCRRYCQVRFGEQTRGPRVYGYAAKKGTCGEYRYMKGGRCVDARTNPPSR
jgi:hypothetical protein